MSGYVVVEIEVLDKDSYEKYKNQAQETVAAYGGRYLVRGGQVEVLEGDWTPKRLVILEFPSVERAKAWWNAEEYREAKALRQSITRSKLIVVEGFNDQF